MASLQCLLFTILILSIVAIFGVQKVDSSSSQLSKRATKVVKEEVAPGNDDDDEDEKFELPDGNLKINLPTRGVHRMSQLANHDHFNRSTT